MSGAGAILVPGLLGPSHAALGSARSREHPLGSGGPNINIIWMGPVLGTPGAESPRARERVVHKLLPIQKFPVTGL